MVGPLPQPRVLRCTALLSGSAAWPPLSNHFWAGARGSLTARPPPEGAEVCLSTRLPGRGRAALSRPPRCSVHSPVCMLGVQCRGPAGGIPWCGSALGAKPGLSSLAGPPAHSRVPQPPSPSIPIPALLGPSSGTPPLPKLQGSPVSPRLCLPHQESQWSIAVP